MCVCVCVCVCARAAERIFFWGETKKGTVMSKRALTVYMQIIITNALMKHHCRHKVSFYMLSVGFFFLLGETE